MTSPVVILVVDEDRRTRHEVAQAVRSLSVPTKVLEAESEAEAARLVREIAQTAQRALADHAGQLERLAEATHRIHAATSPEAAIAASIEAGRSVLGADAALSLVAPSQVQPSAAPDGLTLELALPSPDVPTPGWLTLRRETPFGRAETLIASQIARALALGLERHRLMGAVRASARARQEIVTIVSHDLRTPVHAFSLGLDALRATARNEATVPIFARLDRSIRAMRRLLGDLLDVATIQDGTLPLRLGPHGVAAIIGDVRAGCVEIARQKGLSVTVGAVAPGVLVCDGARIEQALTNLVSNAVKYTDEGGVTLRAIDEGDAIRFEVADTGVGIAPDVQRHLFERLFQHARTTAGGIGLGLYIVRGIAVAHGGTVAVVSALGQGSRFSVRIPRERAPSARNGKT